MTTHAFFDPFGAFAAEARSEEPARRGSAGGDTSPTRAAVLGAERRAQPGVERRAERGAPKRILVTGATGFIGRRLVARLFERGDRVVALTRDRAKAVRAFGGPVEIVTSLDDVPAAPPIDAIVNLAGASIAGGLWTRRRRRVLLESRLATTAALLALVERLPVKPATWINASAIGYYGARNDDECLHERSSAGNGFQAELCRRWEEAASTAAAHGVKVAILRLGVVLGSGGGALAALARPVRWFCGAVMGTGRQWFSWIHIDDLLEVMLFVLDEAALAGPINATAPTPVRHAELMTTIAATLGRPLWPIKIPAVLLRAALGELAELFVDGQRVTPARLEALGFAFRYPTVAPALEHALGRSRSAAAASVSGSR